MKSSRLIKEHGFAVLEKGLLWFHSTKFYSFHSYFTNLFCEIYFQLFHIFDAIKNDLAPGKESPALHQWHPEWKSPFPSPHQKVAWELRESNTYASFTKLHLGVEMPLLVWRENATQWLKTWMSGMGRLVQFLPATTI